MIFYVFTLKRNFADDDGMIRGQIVKMGSSWNPRRTPMTQIEYHPQRSWDLARRWKPGNHSIGFRL